MTLRGKLTRLAYTHPEFRGDLLRLLKQGATGREFDVNVDAIEDVPFSKGRAFLEDSPQGWWLKQGDVTGVINSRATPGLGAGLSSGPVRITRVGRIRPGRYAGSQEVRFEL